MNFYRPLRIIMFLLASAFFFQAGPAQSAENKKDAQTLMNEMRLKKWTKDLDLTAEQQKKFQSLYDEEAKQITALDNDAKVGVNERMTKVNALRQETFAKIKPLLSAAQLEIFEKMLTKTPKKK